MDKEEFFVVNIFFYTYLSCSSIYKIQTACSSSPSTCCCSFCFCFRCTRRAYKKKKHFSCRVVRTRIFCPAPVVIATNTALLSFVPSSFLSEHSRIRYNSYFKPLSTKFFYNSTLLSKR